MSGGRRHLWTVVGAVALILLALGLLAGPAMAADGVGWGGRTTDKSITFFAFGVIAFFPILITLLTIVQTLRERRKQERKSALAKIHR